MRTAPVSSDPFLADISRHIWDSKYRFRDGSAVHDHSIEDSWQRIARALASVEKRDPGAWEHKFYDALAGFKFLPGGRIQAGAGTGRRVTLFNCFVMGAIEDSMDGIFDGLKEGALTMQQGGGIGYDFSSLRPRGMQAKGVGAVASGPVSFMQIWDSMCATLLSTGARRGAMMATLRCDHPDIEQFIEAKQDSRALRHFNLSVLVSDAFMQAVRKNQDWALVFPTEASNADSGEAVMRVWTERTEPVPCRIFKHVPARALWDKLMRATYDYAEPGVLFIDRINQCNNLWYREHISATNPCVAADTWVHTTDGPCQVKDLCGRRFVALVNAQPYQSQPQGFFPTGYKPVYRLRTREGYCLRLTADHPILKITRQTRWSQETAWSRVGDLKAGDRVRIHNHRSAQWSGAYGEHDGYLIGLLIGDGTFAEGSAELRVWPELAAGNAPLVETGVSTVMKKVETIAENLPHRRDFTGWRRSSSTYYFLKLAFITRLAENLGVRRGNKTVTPAMERCSSEFYRGFLQGLFDADGSVQGTQNKGISVRLASSDETLLQSVQRMLLRLGIGCTVYPNRRPAGLRILPDGHGGRRAYQCRADHELIISGDNLHVFSQAIGFTDCRKQARLMSALHGYKRALNRERFTATIESIEPDGVETVFDVQIPGINVFDANGFYAHNCGEIPLPPYGACDLGSINLTYFVHHPFSEQANLDFDGIRATATIAVRMMDNVIDLSQFPLEKQAEQARGSRRIGLGLTGLADTLILLGLHYAEPKARELAAKTMQTICHAAYRASIELAREKGPFPFFEHERYLQGRFIQTLSEDIRADIAHHGIRNSHLTAIAPTGTISLLANNISSGLEPAYDFCYSRKVLELDGTYSEYELSDYAYRQWRRQNGDRKLPQTFVSAQALMPVAHLDMQAALQPYVDNSISKTINVPQEYAFAEFKNIYEKAYNRNLKGCTTFRPNPVTGEVLKTTAEGEKAPHCCNVEREAD